MTRQSIGHMIHTLAHGTVYLMVCSTLTMQDGVPGSAIPACRSANRGSQVWTCASLHVKCILHQYTGIVQIQWWYVPHLLLCFVCLECRRLDSLSYHLSAIIARSMEGRKLAAAGVRSMEGEAGSLARSADPREIASSTQNGEQVADARVQPRTRQPCQTIMWPPFHGRWQSSKCGISHRLRRLVKPTGTCIRSTAKDSCAVILARVSICHRICVSLLVYKFG